MKNYSICIIKESTNTMAQAAKILLESMQDAEMWPDLDKDGAMETVNESINDENICIGIKANDELIGWVTLTPMYEKTWELHPLAISPKYKNKGYGKILMEELEKLAREKGIIGIWLSSGDETNKTSLSEVEITEKNIFEEIKNIKNLKKHPYEFYIKCGYIIIGIVPNAYGSKK